MGKQLHSDDKFKRKIDNYEFDFDDHAWEKMEKLLDNPKPTRSFFNLKNLGFMFTIMLFIYMGVQMFNLTVNQSADDSSQLAARSQQLAVDSLQAANEQAEISNLQLTDNQNFNNEQLASGIQYPVSSIQETNIQNLEIPFVTQIDTQYQTLYTQPPLLLKSKTDSSFLTELKNIHATHNEHYNPEKTYLQLDRTLYKPGESIWFTAYLRDALTHKRSKNSELIYVELIGPNGGVLKKLTLTSTDGSVGGDFQLTPEAVGGMYTVKAYTNWQKNSEDYFERKIQVQKTVLPNLRMELDFEREAYGSGDKAVAKLDLKSLENAPLANHDFELKVLLDGQQQSVTTGKTDKLGKAKVSYNLPTQLTTNDGLFNVIIQYKGQAESISRAIPIVLNEIDLQFLPEGGDMVANLPAKVAFKALNEYGSPADVEGLVKDSKGNTVAQFRSYHQGMGAFDFVPKSGETYTAQITKPANIKGTYTLPSALARGYNLGIEKQTADSIFIKINSSEKEKLYVATRSRDKVYHTVLVKAQKGTQTIGLATENMPIGISEITLFDSKKIARAERLVFLNYSKKLNINITTDKEKYQPREKVTLTLNITDERGMPMPGTFSMAIVDDKILSHADDKQGNILGYMLLESELQGEVREPNFYFEPKEKHPDKDQILALDYLMLTQGWRKFDWVEMENAVATMEFKAEKQEVYGIIKNSYDKPVEKVTVSVLNGKATATTDKDGKYKLSNISLIPPFTVQVASGNIVGKNVTVKNYGELDIKVDFKGKSKIYAGNGNSILRGQVIDSETGEPIIFGNVILKQEGIVRTGVVTDIDGNYQLNNLEDGLYDMEIAYLGYSTVQVKNVKLEDGKAMIADISMNQSEVTLESVTISTYKKPLIQQDNTTQGTTIRSASRKGLLKGKNKDKKSKKKSADMQNAAVQTIRTTPEVKFRTEPLAELQKQKPATTKVVEISAESNTITKEEINKLPAKNITGIVATTAGVTKKDKDVKVRGSRSTATDFYIDGVRVQGGQIPQSELNQNDLLITGTPANKATGEEIEITKALEGKVAGVTTQTEKQPTIKIRGYSSISNTAKPLYVIDGVPVLEKQMKNINPNQIKSIDVLKNENATAIYGSRGANGVVIITTKGNNKTAPKAYQSYIQELENDILNRENQYNTTYQQLQSSLEIGDFTTMEEQLKLLNDLKHHLDKDKKVVLDLAKTFEKESAIATKELASADKFSTIIESYNYAKDFKEGFYAPRQFYAPKYKLAPAMPQVRNDFRSTIHWTPKVEVDRNGTAVVEFYNSDAITTFKAVVEGFGTDGSLGRGEQTYFTQLPIGMSAKAPTNVLIGDQVAIPVTLMNNTDEFVEGNLTIVAPEGFKAVEFLNPKQRLNAQESRTIDLVYEVTSAATDGVFNIKYESDGHFDAFTQEIAVLQRGFPVEEVYAGNAMNQTFDLEIQAPIEGSISATFTAYPSVLDELVTGLERMMRQPTGCFEQTSSSNYPNLLVLDYLKSTNTAKPELEAKANRLLEAGYNRLKTFEVEGGGFDWYGKPPSHEALTAYGLMEFVDMQAVYSVEQELIDRTATWLLSRKDGKGSWQNSKKGLHSWAGKNAPVRDAYIVWAITEAGFGSQINQEIEKSYQDALTTEDPYIMGLVANSLFNIQDNQRASDLVGELLKMQSEDGSWNGLSHSMTHSTGKGLKIETTALAVLAILKNNQLSEANNINVSSLESAIQFIATSKSNYGFGNTQSTILAMKALVAYAKYAKTMGGDGVIQLFVNGKKVGTQAFTSTQSDVIVFDNLENYLSEGKHNIQVKFAKTDTPLPYDLSLTYSTTQPRNNAECVVDLKTELATANTKVGETVRLTTVLTNTKNEAIPNTIAAVGIPSGLTLQPWQLKDLQEKGIFDYYEIIGQYVIFHYRGMDANAVKTIHLDLKADIGGAFEAPASSAYLYYTNEFKVWTKPEKLRINN